MSGKVAFPMPSNAQLIGVKLAYIYLKEHKVKQLLCDYSRIFSNGLCTG